MGRPRAWSVSAKRDVQALRLLPLRGSASEKPPALRPSAGGERHSQAGEERNGNEIDKMTYKMVRDVLLLDRRKLSEINWLGDEDSNLD